MRTEVYGTCIQLIQDVGMCAYKTNRSHINQEHRWPKLASRHGPTVCMNTATVVSTGYIL